MPASQDENAVAFFTALILACTLRLRRRATKLDTTDVASLITARGVGKKKKKYTDVASKQFGSMLILALNGNITVIQAP